MDLLKYAWGGYDDYDVNNLDTALAIQALKAVNYSDVTVISSSLAYLAGSQNTDGGWGFYQGDDSNIYMTVLVLQTLSQFKGTYNLSSPITNAATYLLAHQNADGGLGAPDSTAYETAMTVMALIESGQGQAHPLQNAINYLTATQLVNGSWNNDPYSTALALRALAMVKPNLTLIPSDITFSNPAPTVGDTITITANIKNTGCAQADNVIVQFYSADPNAGGILIGETPGLSIAAYGSSSASITWTIPSAGMGAIYVKLDPANTLDETSEADNMASRNLTPATLPDLYMAASAISFFPYFPEPYVMTLVNGKVRNLGETDATNVLVHYYLGNSTQKLQVWTQTLERVPAGGTADFLGIIDGQFVSSTGLIVYVVVDPLNTIIEKDETNNEAARPLSGGEIADLRIMSYKDITFSPANPREGQDVVISARIENSGTATVRDVAVRFYLGDPESGGVSIAPDTIISSFPAGTFQTLSITWNTAGHLGNNRIYVVIDPENVITERYKTNNKLWRTLKVATSQGPDLFLTNVDIDFSPLSPQAGDIVTMTGRIRNVGNQDAINVPVEFSLGDPEVGGTLIIGESTVPLISAGGTATVRFDWNSADFAGTYEVYVNVDPENLIVELDETNNLANSTLVVTAPQGPDLAVTSIDTSGMVTDTQALTVSGSIAVTVKNKGNQPTTVPFEITAFEDSNSDKRLGTDIDNILGQATYAGTLAAGAADIINIPVSGTVLFRDNLIYVLADSSGAIQELDETNNMRNTGQTCEYAPPVGSINPVEKWAWTKSSVSPLSLNVTMTPSVIDLNQDGIPDVVFGSTASSGGYMDLGGILRALDGRTGAEIFTVTNPLYYIDTTCSVAVGDIDLDGLPEIIACAGSRTNLIAFNRDGSFKWQSDTLQAFSMGAPSLADLNGDGIPEIIMGHQVLDNTGKLLWTGAGNSTGTMLSLVADMNLDGRPEVVAGNSVYDADGILVCSATTIADGRVAVGNFNGDPYPEIVHVSPGWITLLDHACRVIWRKQITQIGYGGAPVIADFDGDGSPEIGVAGGARYVVLKADGTILWRSVISDNSSSLTAASVFDFDGDGRAEVVYRDEKVLRIYRGSNGDVLSLIPMSSCTWYEYVIVADVDGDNKAEIVAVANNNCGYGIQQGVHVFGSADNSWVNARRIWNQHTYHITNVNDDGTIPRHEENSWERYNTYRCNSMLPDQALATADITASRVLIDWGNYPSSVTLSARIGNGGSLSQPEGVEVRFYDGDPKAGAGLKVSTLTSRVLAPGEYEDVSAQWNNPPSINIVFAVADELNKVNECRENNNLAATMALPDLEIVPADVSLTPASPKEGQSVLITASVRNRGGPGASDVHISFYDGDPHAGGTLIGSASTTDIVSGTAFSATVKWNTWGLSGRNYIYIIADPDNAITEMSEDNNQVIIAVDVDLPSNPDLSVEASDISISNPSPRVGAPITVTAMVHNLGLAVGPVDVCLYDGDPRAGGLLAACKIISEIIPLGGIGAVNFNIAAPGTVGTHELFVVADPQNLIAEGDETNNSSSLSMVIGKPSFGLSVSTDKQTYAAGESVLVTVDIVNRNLDIDPLVGVVIEDGAGNVVTDIGSVAPERMVLQGWSYRVPAQVSIGYAKQNAMAETTLNFTQLLGSLGVSPWTVDINSIRVLEVASSGALVEKQARAVFIGDHKATTTWVMDGPTEAGVARNFYIYFDILENGSKPLSLKTTVPGGGGLIAHSDSFGNLYVIRNNGDGTFGAPQLVDAAQANSDFGIAVADFNNDGYDDVIDGSGTTGEIFYYQNKADGTDTFLSKTKVGSIVKSIYIMDMAVADFDGDGNNDFVVSGNDFILTLFKGRGDGTFSISTVESPVGPNFFRGKAAADFDGDGKMDLVAGGYYSGPLFFYKGNGDGTFAAPSFVADLNIDTYGVTAGDFDGDGLRDIIAHSNGIAYIVKGKGDGRFYDPIAIPSLAGSYNVIDSGDFNNDGKMDILAASYSFRILDFFPGNGNGTFGAKKTIAYTPNAAMMGLSSCASPHGDPAVVSSAEKLPPQTYTLTWNAGTIVAGTYKVHGRLTGGQELLDAYANFTIVPDKTLASKVVADRTAYMANQAVTLTSTITSQSANYTFNNLSATISITKSDGQAIFTETKTIATLLPGQTLELKTYWNTGTYPPGVYPASISVKDASGTVVTTSSTTITISGEIKPSKLLKGTIWVDRQHILQGDPVTISYNVTNAGNMDLPDIGLSVLTVHVVNQSVYDTLPDHASLLMGQIHTNSQVLQTTTYTAKDYLVILRANIGGTEETLSGTYIRVEGAPSAPSLNGPESGADVLTLTPVLIVNNAADPNADKLTYEFELYRDSGLTDLVTSSGILSEASLSTSWQIPMTLSENTTYYWRSRAYDGLLYGDWMPPARFRVNVENDTPTTPTTASPINNTAVSSLTPVLTVNNASDPDSTILTYNFEISLDQGFTQPISSVVGVFEGAGTTSWQVDIPLQENTYYYWRAQADDWLTTGVWSETASFFVNTTNEAPSAPVIMSPSQGSSIASLSTDITASNSLDPDSTGLTYVFEIDAAATFDTPALKTSGSIPEGQSNTLWNVAGLQDNTPYYLRAKASDGQAESPWSDTVSFFVNTANDVPTVPVLANPSDGGAVSVAAPLLAVHNATDADGDALTYDFELYADASLTNLVTGAAGIPETPMEITWSVPMALTENRTYFWRARAYDGQAYSGWMPLASFFVNTANDAPSAPTLYAPTNGSSLQTLTPTLSVTNAIDPDSDVLTYDFEIYSGTTLVKTIAGVAQNASGITSVTASLSDNTTYTWRARAYDGDRYSGWMDTAAFSILMPSTGITVEIEVEPETLNRKSHGNWVSVEIELPRGYHARDVKIDSIRLEGVVPAEPWPYHLGCNHEDDEDDHHDGHGDHDRDGDHNEREFKVKFKRSEVLKVLPDGNKVKVHVTGMVGTITFEGVDTIRVMK